MTPAPTPHAKVAVIVRTKNRPLLLARALDSVLAQTYQDYLVVIVNDAGELGPVQDAIAAVADRANGRIVVVDNEVSRGREAAMNTGVDASSSTYIVMHDDDDAWAPTFLERTVAHLEDTGQQAVGTRSEVVYERVEDDVIISEGRELLATDKTDITLLDTIVRNYTPTNSLLYRRSVHDEIGEYDEGLPVLADWDFMLRLLQVHEVGFIDGDPLAFWHRRPDSVGDEGNSVHAGRDEHSHWDAVIRDRYLRADLKRDGGLGYLLVLAEILDRDRKVAQDRGAHIANEVRYVHDRLGPMTELLNGTATQVGYLHDRFGALTELHTSLHDAVNRLQVLTQDGLVAQVAELNRNLVSQNNRFVAQFERLNSRVVELERAVARTPIDRLRRYGGAARRRLRRVVGRS